MKKVIITRGLPASGKTTWAKKLIDEHPNTYKRINKDDLRAMLDNGKYSTDSEKMILEARNALILIALNNGKHVIIDDTNLSPRHAVVIRELVRGKADVVVEDFTHISLEDCIERDLKRCSSVGEKIIRKMYNQFLSKSEPYIEDKGLPKAIIIDIDGTLSTNITGRSPFDWNRVGEDLCNETVKNIVNSYNGHVIICSGRDSVCKQTTVEWLKSNNIKYNMLLMREKGNVEKDSIIKKRLFEDNIKGKFFVEYVLDDRNQVVDMWRSIGLTCLQVAEGDF